MYICAEVKLGRNLRASVGLVVLNLSLESFRAIGVKFLQTIALRLGIERGHRRKESYKFAPSVGC